MPATKANRSSKRAHPPSGTRVRAHATAEHDEEKTEMDREADGEGRNESGGGAERRMIGIMNDDEFCGT